MAGDEFGVALVRGEDDDDPMSSLGRGCPSLASQSAAYLVRQEGTAQWPVLF